MNNLDKIVEDIKIKTKNYNELETLRYVYIYLGNMFNFNTEYYFGSNKKKYKIYRECLYNRNIFDKKLEDKNIICICLSYIMEHVGKKLDINIISREEPNAEKVRQHYLNYVTLKDNTKFFIDLQCDLDNIQTKCKTEYFGINEFGKEIIKEEKLLEIDKKIGYIKEDELYTNDYLYMIKKAIEGDYPMEVKFDLAIKSLNMYTDISSLKYVERYVYYKKMIKLLFNKEYNKIKFIDSYQVINNKRVGTLIVYVRTKGNFYKLYKYNQELNNFENIKYIELENEITKGLVLTKQIPIRKKVLNNYNI